MGAIGTLPHPPNTFHQRHIPLGRITSNVINLPALLYLATSGPLYGILHDMCSTLMGGSSFGLRPDPALSNPAYWDTVRTATSRALSTPNVAILKKDILEYLVCPDSLPLGGFQPKTGLCVCARRLKSARPKLDVSPAR